jgi:hydroxymethylglutaryl-CoA reductase
MGMNMVSKGVQNVLESLQIDFPDMDVIGISGNLSLSLNLLLLKICDQ